MSEHEECEVRDPRYTASVICTLTKGHDGLHYDFENPGLGMWHGPEPIHSRSSEEER